MNAPHRDDGFFTESLSSRDPELFAAMEGVRTSLGDALAALSEDEALLTELREQGSPVNIVLGDDYRALAEEQAEIAARIWEETPWK